MTWIKNLIIFEKCNSKFNFLFLMLILLNFFSFFNEITFLKWHSCLAHIHYMNIFKRMINEHFVINIQITSSNKHVYFNYTHEKNQFINIFLLDIDFHLMHFHRFAIMFWDKHVDTMFCGI